MMPTYGQYMSYVESHQVSLFKDEYFLSCRFYKGLLQCSKVTRQNIY
jgi:hypothetical protein